MMQSDEELLRQMARGNSKALAELYDRYGRLVFSLALRVVGNNAQAEEISQDVFIKVWNNADSYQPGMSKVSTWLTSITRYRSIDVLRRSSVRPDGHMLEDALEELPLPSAKDELPEVQIEHRIEMQRVQAALADLPAEQAQVLQLAYFDGLSQPEMAEILKQPLGTVKTRVRLGLQKLRRVLEGQEIPES